MIGLSLLTTIGFASLGYFINEFFDKESDAKAGKLNKLAFLPFWTQGLILAAILLITFLPWVFLPKDHLSLLLIFTQISLFLLYSLPFPRLKENAYLSLVIDALYAYTLPLLLSFHTFSLLKGSHYFPLWFILFSVSAGFIGLRNILTHQVKDVFKDAAAGQKSLPMLLGPIKTQLLLTLIFAYEVFSIALTLVVFSINFWFLSILLIAYLWFALDVFKRKGIKENTSNMFQEINKAYNLVFPLLALLVLLIKWPIVLVILLIHSSFLVPFNVWKYLHSKVMPILIRIRVRIHSFVVTDLRNAISAMVNYPIYFLFRLAGIDLKKEGTSAMGYFRKRRRSK